LLITKYDESICDARDDAPAAIARARREAISHASRVDRRTVCARESPLFPRTRRLTKNDFVKARSRRASTSDDPRRVFVIVVFTQSMRVNRGERACDP